MLITLALSWKSTVLTIDYFPPIQLTGKYACTPVYFYSFNSIQNFDYDNNLFRIVEQEIEIPVGSQELEEIVNNIKAAYEKQNGLKKVEIVSNNNIPQI